MESIEPLQRRGMAANGLRVLGYTELMLPCAG